MTTQITKTLSLMAVASFHQTRKCNRSHIWYSNLILYTVKQLLNNQIISTGYWADQENSTDPSGDWMVTPDSDEGSHQLLGRVSSYQATIWRKLDLHNKRRTTPVLASDTDISKLSSVQWLICTRLWLEFNSIMFAYINQISTHSCKPHQSV